jgi:hypothetical protein
MQQAGDGNDKLLAFIRESKAKGLTDDFASKMLKQNGWSDQSIFAAYAKYYADDLGVVVPSHGSGMENARNAFFYLLAFITLGVWAFAVGNLFYIAIDRLVVDTLNASYEYEFDASHTQIAYDIASLIVAFPIFLWMSYIIQRETIQRPEVLDSGVRKWLTYLALVITAGSLMGDAVMFLQQFLSGSLSEGFILKSLVLIAIAGGIFVYYLGAVRAQGPMVRRDQLFAIGAIVAVVVGIGLGFQQNGSPVVQRGQAFDDRRIQDLRMLSITINNYYNGRGHGHKLPSDVTEFSTIGTTTNDPETNTPYEYRTLGGSRYQLCATFDSSSIGQPDADKQWPHTAGRTCFTRDATL